ncbi:MAG: lysophospholipid acyltransferase family protein [Fidelibacterota bacterium]|nr:MAG: lysophospholipid acyltransferase family protein [Candidatus Neomarinimicrobiota bacterium]
MPRPWALALGRLLGRGLYLFFPYRKDVARDNLRLAFPEFTNQQRRTILYRTYQHFGMVLIDFLRIPTLSLQNLEALIQMDDTQLREVHERGGGALIMSGHLGNWELMARKLVSRRYPLTAVMVPQRGAGGAFVQAIRDRIGCEYIPKKTSTRQMLRLLKEGRFLGLVGDQDARKSGVWVSLFGRPSSRPRGSAVFALQTGAPIIVGWCLLQKDRRYHLQFKSISTENLPAYRDQAIQTLTQRYTSALETAIRQHPEQYFWFHRMWKTRPVNT